MTNLLCAAAMCGDVELLPMWMRELHTVGQNAIFGRPETFRDQWTEGESMKPVQTCNVHAQLQVKLLCLRTAECIGMNLTV